MNNIISGKEFYIAIPVNMRGDNDSDVNTPWVDMDNYYSMMVILEMGDFDPDSDEMSFNWEVSPNDDYSDLETIYGNDIVLPLDGVLGIDGDDLIVFTYERPRYRYVRLVVMKDNGTPEVRSGIVIVGNAKSSHNVDQPSNVGFIHSTLTDGEVA